MNSYIALDPNAAIPADLRDLLPHFTVRLWGELEKRIATRILDSTWEEVKVWPNLWDTDEELPAEWAWRLASECVARIYRTQLREALHLISFSDAMIRANPKPAEEAKASSDAIFRKRVQGLTTKFRSA